MGTIAFVLCIATCHCLYDLIKKNFGFWLFQKKTQNVEKIINADIEIPQMTQPDSPCSKSDSETPGDIVSREPTPPDALRQVVAKPNQRPELNRKISFNPSQDEIDTESGVIAYRKITSPIAYKKFKELYKGAGDVSPIKPPVWASTVVPNFAAKKCQTKKVEYVAGLRFSPSDNRIDLEFHNKMSFLPKNRRAEFGLQAQFRQLSVIREESTIREEIVKVGPARKDSWEFPQLDSVVLTRDLAQDFISEQNFEYDIESGEKNRESGSDIGTTRSEQQQNTFYPISIFEKIVIQERYKEIQRRHVKFQEIEEIYELGRSL